MIRPGIRVVEGQRGMSGGVPEGDGRFFVEPVSWPSDKQFLRRPERLCQSKVTPIR